MCHGNGASSDEIMGGMWCTLSLTKLPRVSAGFYWNTSRLTQGHRPASLASAKQPDARFASRLFRISEKCPPCHQQPQTLIRCTRKSDWYDPCFPDMLLGSFRSKPGLTCPDLRKCNRQSAAVSRAAGCRRVKCPKKSCYSVFYDLTDFDIVHCRLRTNRQ